MTARATQERSPGAPEQARILDAAERLFASRGYAETRMQEIAAAARTSLRNVYAVAKGKAEIFRMLHEVRARDLLGQVGDVLADKSRDPGDVLMDVIDVVMSFLMEHTDFLDIQLRHGLAWSLRDPEHTLAEARDTADRGLETLFRRGIRAGVFLDEGPKTMVASLRALEQVQLAAWLENPRRLGRRAVIERVQAQARRLYLA